MRGEDFVLLLLVRGGVCIEIPQVWGDWFVLAKCLPLLCEVVFVLVVPCLFDRLYWLREELCTPGCCIAPNPQWRFPVWEVLCGQVSGNPSAWRRGRRAGCSNLETYPCVCVWSIDSISLSLSLSLLYFALNCFILSYHTYMLGCDCLCTSLVFNHESFI